MNRGYSGYYNGIYLRSSYEYAYALYLDNNGTKWGYERETFDLGYKLYKPDFFIYDNNSNLIEIVEVKSRNKKVKEEACKSLQTLKEMYGINGRLISYEELLELYKEMPYALTSVLNEWITSENTTINKTLVGELNPHFNMKHNESTKELIRSKSLQRWETQEVRQRMLLGGQKGAEKMKSMKGKIHKVEREDRECPECGSYFKVIQTSSQIYCSTSCSAKVNGAKGTTQFLENNNKLHKEILEFVLNWVRENKIDVVSANYSRIKPTLDPLLEKIDNKFGIKDIRVITKCLLGEEKGRRELLSYLKEKCPSNSIDDHNYNVELREFVIEWAKQNQDYVSELPFKKIKDNLIPLSKVVNEKFGLNDSKLRPIQRAIFGYDKGLSELLLFLKNIQ